IPINYNFLFDIQEDGKCDVYARNSELQMKGFMTVTTKEAVKICVPGTTLMNTIKLLTEEEINFNYNPEKFILNISAGKKKYKLTGENPKDYIPQQVPEDAIEYKNLASKIIPHITTLSKVVDWKDMRPQLQGITFNVIDGNLILSGTHGAFFFCRCLVDTNVDDPFSFVLPKECSMALAQMKGHGDIEMFLGKRAVFFKVEGFELRSSLVEVTSVIEIDKYFVYNDDQYLIMDKNDLGMATKRMVNYANSDEATLRIEVMGDELKLSSDNEDFGREAEEILDVSNHENKDMVVGLNMRYAAAIMGAIDSDKIKAFFVNFNKPVFFQNGDGNESSQVWGCAPIILKEHLNG
ncbi:MAG: hypothetical protein ACTSRU_19650, partial [Candidatus Hodarchaeales archaeon]